CTMPNMALPGWSPNATLQRSAQRSESYRSKAEEGKEATAVHNTLTCTYRKYYLYVRLLLQAQTNYCTYVL
ncbi:hypothetical protein, partial [Brucella melitensis]|uniref:hypothetical protein n=4 Tax=Brucella melitensis TaxID=29459 RepID=UPI0031FC3AC5